jgi:hypothetical protein
VNVHFQLSKCLSMCWLFDIILIFLWMKIKVWFGTWCCCTISNITVYLMLTNVIHSFQKAKPFQMEQIVDRTCLKSQVMGSPSSHPTLCWKNPWLINWCDRLQVITICVQTMSSSKLSSVSILRVSLNLIISVDGWMFPMDGFMYQCGCQLVFQYL